MEEKVNKIYNNPLNDFMVHKNNAPITIEILKTLQGKNLSVNDAQSTLNDAIKILPMISYFS